MAHLVTQNADYHDGIVMPREFVAPLEAALRGERPLDVPAIMHAMSINPQVVRVMYGESAAMLAASYQAFVRPRLLNLLEAHKAHWQKMGVCYMLYRRKGR